MEYNNDIVYIICINIPYRKILYISLMIFLISILNSINDNLTNIPELKYYTQQKLKLFIPKKIYNSICHKTIFFTSNYRNNSDITKYNIVEFINTKNSFVTYYLDDSVYSQYPNLFASNGLIRSNNIYSDNNLILCTRAMRIIKNSSLFGLNKYQKIYRLSNIHQKLYLHKL